MHEKHAILIRYYKKLILFFENIDYIHNNKIQSITVSCYPTVCQASSDSLPLSQPDTAPSNYPPKYSKTSAPQANP